MSKAKILVLCVAAAIGAGFALWSEPAHCAWCSPYDCYQSSNCGSGCVCLKKPMALSGKCFSVE